MWFPITTLGVLACIGVARHHERRSALTLALYAWAASLALAAPIAFSYSGAYSLKADVFVAACICATTVAYRLRRQRPRSAPGRYMNRARELSLAKLMGALGAGGCVLLLADAVVNGQQFSVSYLLANLGRIRSENFDKLANYDNRAVIGTLGGLAAPCGILCILAAVRLGRDGGRTLRPLAVVNFVLLAAVSLGVFAGRATITNVIMLSLVSLYLSRGRFLRCDLRTLLIVSVAAVGVWYFATTWLATREENVSTLRILEKNQRAKMRPWINSLAQRQESVGLAMVSIGYFASPIPAFHYYLASPTLPGPFYGTYSYPLPARLAGTINGTWTREQWYDTRQEIYAPIASRGYFDNVWTTWLRDLLVDFGYLGAIGFCSLFGAFMAWARNRYQMTGALHYHYFEVIACFTLGFGAFTSFVWDAFLAYPFFASFLVMFLVRARLTDNPGSSGRIGDEGHRGRAIPTLAQQK